MNLATPTATIERLDENDPGVLFCHYPGQHCRQDVGMTIDLESGILTCQYDPLVGGGSSEALFHRRALWIPMECLIADKANALMDEVKPLADRILAGASIDWNGNNHVGTLNDDATAALDELSDRIAPEAGDPNDDSTVSEYDADDWFSGEGRTTAIARLGLTADSTDDELAAMAAAEQAEAIASCPGHMVLTGIKEWLTATRDDLRNA